MSLKMGEGLVRHGYSFVPTDSQVLCMVNELMISASGAYRHGKVHRTYYLHRGLQLHNRIAHRSLCTNSGIKQICLLIG